MNGHKAADCDGVWIDISTLVEPRREMCLKCRGTRRTRSEDEMLAGPPTLAPGERYEAIGELATEDHMKPRLGTSLWECLGYLATAFACGVLLGMLF